MYKGGLKLNAFSANQPYYLVFLSVFSYMNPVKTKLIFFCSNDRNAFVNYRARK